MILTHIPFWKQVPFFRVLLALIAGIIFQRYFTFEIIYLLILLGLNSLSFYLFDFLPLYFRFHFQFIQSILLLLSFFFLGMILVWNNEIKNHDIWFGNHLNNGEILIIKIEEPLTEKEKNFTTIGSVVSMVNHDTINAVSGKIILQFKKSVVLNGLYYGDKIAVKKTPQIILKNANPGGFNYANYMSAMQIYHQLFLNENDFVKINRASQKDLYYYVYKIRDQTINKLHFYFNSNQKVLGIAEALMIGYKNNLDKEVVSAYSKTGVVHIIAISGLHLGLIYMLLIWIFKRIPLVNRIALVQSVAIVCCLWIFSLITGASASVLRSAVMFTCIIFGKSINRKSSIYNAIAGSAFLLLCYNPLYFWDVGFELSYLAIIGIVWLQKPMQSLISPKFIFFKKIWEMSSVTLAAQIMSFPICIYYFHQFPNYFLLSNLIAIPLSTLILFAEIILICFSWMPLIAVNAVKFIYWTIILMNHCIEAINNFPFSIIDNISISLIATILIYTIIFSLILFWTNKKRIYLSFLLLFISCLNVSTVIASIQTSNQRKIIIYNINKQTAVDFIEKQECYFIGDTIFNQSSIAIKQKYLYPTRLFYRCNLSGKNISIKNGHEKCIEFCNKKLLIIDSALNIPTNEKQIEVLLISQNPNIKLDKMLNVIVPKIVVFDGSNSLWKIAKWKKECEALNLQYFSTREQGAFVFDLK